MLDILILQITLCISFIPYSPEFVNKFVKTCFEFRSHINLLPAVPVPANLFFLPCSPPCFLAFPSLTPSFSPSPPPCSLIFLDLPVLIILSLPSALSSYLPASLDLSAHTLFAHAFSLLSLPFPFSRSALFFFLFHHHFSALLRSSPYAYSPLFPFSRLSSFLSSSYIVFSSFRTFHTFFFLFVPVFVSPFLFPFLVYPFPFIHTLSHLPLPPLSPVLAFLTFFLSPPFSHSPPFLPRLPLPFPAKTILPDFSLRHKKTEGRSLPFFNRNNLLKKTISSARRCCPE